MILNVLKESLTITSFVFAMMLLIDYLNLITRGRFDSTISKKQHLQYIITSFLGATPGCLGAFMNVSFYMHGIITFGALAGGMIATSGDESFVMLTLFPKTALLLFAVLFIVGALSGYITDKLFPFLQSGSGSRTCSIYSDILSRCECRMLSFKEAVTELKNITLERFLILALLTGSIYGVITAGIGPEEFWMRATFVIVLVLALFVALTVPLKYLEEHLWEHIAKRHAVKVLLWTFAALLVLQLALAHLPLENIVRNNLFMVLLLSILIGILPTTGPHMIFVVMFSRGMIPFSILLASSIVQDGHGMLPLLSCSIKDSIKVKAVNILFGFILGSILLLMGL